MSSSNVTRSNAQHDTLPFGALVFDLGLQIKAAQSSLEHFTGFELPGERDVGRLHKFLLAMVYERTNYRVLDSDR